MKLSEYLIVHYHWYRVSSIKGSGGSLRARQWANWPGRATGKLTGCERELAINLPGCFRLLFLPSFIGKTKNAQLKNSTDLLHKNLMKPLKVASIESSYDRNQRSVQVKQRLFGSKSKWCLKLQFCKRVNIIKVLVLCLTLLNENKKLRLNAYTVYRLFFILLSTAKLNIFQQIW